MAAPQANEAPVEPKTALQAVKAAGEAEAAGKPLELTADETVDALDWFLADTDDTDLTYSFQLNVGSSSGKKKWVQWTVKPVDLDELRRIRKKAQQKNRRPGQTAADQQYDDIAANVQIVVEGTVYPDLRAATKQLGAIDPATVVRSRFAHKPGLISQIANEVMALSGYDDDDVREVDAAQG